MVMLDVAEQIYSQSGALGQASREADQYANVTGNLSESWLQLKATMGSNILEAVIPVMQTLAGWMDNLRYKVEDLNDWIDSNKDAVSGWITYLAERLGEFRVFWLTTWDEFRWKVNNFIDRFRPQIEAISDALIEFRDTIIDRFTEAKDDVAGLWVTIKGAIKSAFDYLSPHIATFLDEVSELGDDFWEAFDNVKTAISAFVNWASPFLGAFWNSIVTAVGEGLKLLPDLWDNMLNTISGLASAFTNVLNGDFSGAWEDIKGIFSGWKSFFTDLFDSLKEVFAPLKKWFMDNVWEPIKSVLNLIIDGIESVMNGVVDMLNSKPMTFVRKAVALLPGGKSFDDIGDIEHISIPRLAEGGVVTDETHFIAGEQGDEAIIPLEKSDVIDTFAEKIATIINSGDGGTGSFAGLSVHGVSEALIEADDTLSEISKKIREVSRNGADWTASVESINEYAEIINDQYDAQNEKLQILNRRYELAVAEGGEMSTNAQETKTKIEELTLSIHDTQTEMYKVVEAFDTLEEKSKSASDETKKSWAQALASLKEGFADWVKSTQNDFTIFMGELGDTISSVKDVIDEYITPLFDAIAELQEQQLENEINILEAEYEELQKINEQKLIDKEKSLDEENAALKQQLYDGKITYRDYVNSVKANEQALANYKTQLADEESVKENELAKKKDELARKQFEANKQSEIANIWINLATGIMKTYAQSGWVLGTALAALMTTTARVQAETIASQQYVPALARGGIVDEPTLSLIGEAGREAVVPLENNTEWTNEVAGALAPALETQDSNLRLELVQLRQMVADFFTWMRDGNIRVMMDGQIVGRLVSPYVNNQLGRSSALRARGI